MVLIKAKRLPPRLPRPQGGLNTPKEVPPLAPLRRGSLFSEAAKRPHRGDSLPARKKLAARLGAWAEIGACAPNRSPKPSLTNCLAFGANARVDSPKAVNGGLSASVEFAALQ
jgi:hypothetical protein